MGYWLVFGVVPLDITPTLFERATVYIVTGCYRELGAQILRLTVPHSGALCKKMAPESGVAKAAAAALAAKTEAAAAVRQSVSSDHSLCPPHAPPAVQNHSLAPCSSPA